MPRRGRSRSFEWGRARRPKISSKLGIPNPREGSDGDMQVRQTGIGARIFAKLGGRWLSNVLYGNEIDDPDVFVPKVWTKDFDLPTESGENAGNNPVTLGILPEFINFDDIIAFTVNLYYVGSFLVAPSWVLGAAAPYTSHFTSALFHIKPDTRLIKVTWFGGFWSGRIARVSIFYK